jgi:hypothetical protein
MRLNAGTARGVIESKQIDRAALIKKFNELRSQGQNFEKLQVAEKHSEEQVKKKNKKNKKKKKKQG